MSRAKDISDDPLVMAVRAALKAIEPRPKPTERRRDDWGFEEQQCPECKAWCNMRRGSYEHHWKLLHGTPFWREKHLIAVVRGEEVR